MNEETEAGSVERGYEERVVQARQAAGFVSRQTVPDLSGLSGPHGEPLGLPETRVPGMSQSGWGPPRMPRNFKEDDPPQLEPKTIQSGTNANSNLGFPARSVMVDNFTPQWLYINAAQKYIPPWVFGVVVPLLVATQNAQATWEAPPGTSQPGPLAGAFALTYWVEKELGGATGISGTEWFGAEDPQKVAVQGPANTPTTATLTETSQTTAAGAQIAASVGPGGAGLRSYITGFDIELGPGAAAAVVTATVTGLTNQLNYPVACGGAGANVQGVSVRFPAPLPAAALNSAVTVTVPAIGGAAAVNAVNVYGFNA